MKYYSEKLDQLFDSKTELEYAEKSADLKKIMDADDDEEDCEDTISEATPSRKQLASDVESAENKLKEEYANYEVAKQKVEELSKKYLEEVDSIMEPAKKAVQDAERARYEAIRKFNEAYGAYQVTLTGDRAAQEMVRALNDINNIHRNIFKNIFWF